MHFDLNVKQNLVIWAILWRNMGFGLSFFSAFNKNIKLPNFITIELQFAEYKQLLQDVQINTKHSSTQYKFLSFDVCFQQRKSSFNINPNSIFLVFERIILNDRGQRENILHFKKVKEMIYKEIKKRFNII